MATWLSLRLPLKLTTTCPYLYALLAPISLYKLLQSLSACQESLRATALPVVEDSGTTTNSCSNPNSRGHGLLGEHYAILRRLTMMEHAEMSSSGRDWQAILCVAGVVLF
ncbi:hypothetical protein ARMSODRAFT_1019674 [Armillaria solidipes]|uniref:Uncharacterized protein n=1 Tax=Armillaria solidipes TaxID=1076256 RepID=A0A2H3BCF8_9AGAR|nr:hypothetical protein ARMSODRAFT_1019674 [Armillaria solidipes]